MNSYKFYLKNSDNVVIGSGGFDAEDTDAAIRIVRVRCGAWLPSGHSYELLQDNRVVHREGLQVNPETDERDQLRQ